MTGKNNILGMAVVAVLAIGAISVVMLNGNSNGIAYADDKGNENSGKMMEENYHQQGRASGQIASIQNDDNGQPAWVASGAWRLFIMPPESNSTQSDAKFLAKFTMVKLDGTSKHMHTISDFVMTNMSDDGNTTTLTGNATMTMKDSPQKNIPITIKIMNHNTISIMLDPKVNAHLGNTPLYGIVSRTNEEYHAMVHMGKAMMEEKEHDKMSDKSMSGKGEQHGQAEDEHPTVEIVSGAASTPDKAFSPNPLTVKARTEVTWKNKDTAIHTVTSGKSGSPDGVFDSKILSPNKEFKFEFKDAGTFDYYCQLHPAMVGTVTVQ
jgi:plastocyanin